MRTVLVADDDSNIRALIRTILEGAGHNVLEAGSAVEVFELLDLQVPDVILLDVHLGTDDGLAIGVGLRRERRFRDVTMIFMTGTLDMPELLRQSRLFNVEILPKPFEPNELIAVIEAGPERAASP